MVVTAPDGPVAVTAWRHQEARHPAGPRACLLLGHTGYVEDANGKRSALVRGAPNTVAKFAVGTRTVGAAAGR